MAFAMFGLLFSAMAQSTVTGTVTDENGEGLPGATILIKGTTTGSTADIDGKYSIKVPNEESILVFSFVGYNTTEVKVGNQSSINIKMNSSTVLTELVVTGYKSYIKEKSNISAVTIGAEKIKNRPNPNAIQTLSGQIAGVSISASTGQPGAAPVVRIRGTSSVNGSSDPLYVVDGVPMLGNFRSLNPNEIATITVLKDAGATAIYGNRGANGVVVIQTKTGGYDSPLQVNYSGQYIRNTLQDNDYNLMGSPEQLRLEKLYGSGRGATPGLSYEDIDATPTFDWSDFFFRTAIGQNHNLQLSKGGKSSNFLVSLGYLNQEGILVNSALERYSLRTNLGGKSDNGKFNYALNVSVNYSKNNEPNNIGGNGINRNFLIGAYEAVPYITPDDYVDGQTLTSPLNFANTPLFLLDLQRTFTRSEKEIKSLASLSLSYEIIDGLVLQSVTSLDFENRNLLRAEAPNSFNALLFAETGNTTPGFQQQNNAQQFTYNQVTSLSYTKVLNEKHTLGVSLYNEFFKARSEFFGYFQRGLDPRTFSPGDGSGFINDNSDNDFFIDDANASISEASLLAYFATVDYDYDTRFGLGVTVRRDASSKFFGSDRWGTFWSVSGRWNVANEDFFDIDAVNVLKLRASYGTNGNQQINGTGYFTSLDLYRPLFATGGGYGGNNSIFLSQIPNDAVKWETVSTANIGLDLEMFQGRLRALADVYRKTTTDLFLAIPISAVNATTRLNGNFGELRNSGVELQLDYDIISRPQSGFKLTINFVGAYNKEELIELPEDEIPGIGRVGGQLFEYFTVPYAGVNPQNGNLLFYNQAGELTENPDQNADRQWLDKDLSPEYNGSFGFNVEYKGFYFTTQFNYLAGQDRFDGELASFQDPTDIGQFRSTRDLVRAWTPTNRYTDIPSLTATNLSFNGSRYLRQSDYVRLRFINLGYELPTKWAQKIKARNASVFVNAENLITFTEWRGFDAETLTNVGRQYPTPRSITFGIQLGF